MAENPNSVNERTTAVAPKTSILDRNASWPLMVVYIGYLVGIYFAQRASENYISADYSSYAYFLLSILLGIVLTFVLYNVGKIAFAKKQGYELINITILGMFFDFTKGKAKVSFNILDFFSLSMQFAPKDDDTEKNPKLLFLGGIIVEGLIAVLCLVAFFVLWFTQHQSVAGNFGWTMLFIMLYGLIVPLYEMIPLRQDNPTDMFNLMVIRTEEDRKAFNVCQINKKKDLTGEDYLVVKFDDYDSFYKAHCLYPLYLDYLYASKADLAFKVVEDMKYYKKHFTDVDSYLSSAETIYLKYAVGDNDGADKLYLSLNGEDRKAVRNAGVLSDYRIAVLVLGYITSDTDAINELVAQWKKETGKYAEPYSRRVTKEISLFKQAYKKLQMHKANLNLPDLEEKQTPAA